MRYLFASALVVLGLASTSTAAHSPQGGSPDKQCRVRSIYVESLGGSDDAGWFRRELQKQLKKKRFTLAAKAGDAEGVLTGRFSFEGSSREGKVAFDSGELRDASGARLWHGNFYYTRRDSRSFPSRHAIKDAAPHTEHVRTEPQA